MSGGRTANASARAAFLLTPIKVPVKPDPLQLKKFIVDTAELINTTLTQPGRKSVTVEDKRTIFECVRALKEAGSLIGKSSVNKPAAPATPAVLDLDATIILPVPDEHTGSTSTDSPLPNSSQPVQPDLRTVVREELQRFKSGLITEIKNTVTTTVNSTVSTATKSYADAAAAMVRPVQKPAGKKVLPTKHAIIVSSATGSTAKSKDVADEWRKKISFRDQNFAPTSVAYVSKGKVRIEFAEHRHCQVAKQKAAAAADKLKVEDAKLLNPRVILKGVSKSVPVEEVADIIFKQNVWLAGSTSAGSTKNNSAAGSKPAGSTPFIKAFVLNNRNNPERLYNIVLEVPPAYHRQMIEMGQVNLDHQRVHVQNHCRFKQCGKCLQFGHTTSRCTEETGRCAHCGSAEHTISKCTDKTEPKKARCFNCHQWNRKSNGGEPTSHRATDIKKCQIAQDIMDRVNAAVDYGY